MVYFYVCNKAGLSGGHLTFGGRFLIIVNVSTHPAAMTGQHSFSFIHRTAERTKNTG